MHKVRKAMSKITKLAGWRAKMGAINRTYRPPAEHFGMDQPDEMPPPEEEGIMAPSLHQSSLSASLSSGDGALKLASIDIADPAGTPGGAGALLSPTGTEPEGESRAQRYNRALRERMDARGNVPAP